MNDSILKVVEHLESDRVVEAAQSFTELTLEEKNRKIEEVAEIFNSETNRINTFGLAADFLKEGLFDDLLKFSRHYEKIDLLTYRGLGPKTALALVLIDQTTCPFYCSIRIEGSARIFARKLRGMPGYHKFTADQDVVAAIYRYCCEFFGQRIGVRSRIVHYAYYIPYAALVLQETYGKERVITLLDKMIEEQGLEVLDFIRIIESDVDLSNTPLSWAVNF